MTKLYDLELFNYYRRYRWTAQNFTDLQASLIGYPATLLSAMVRDGVLMGLNKTTDSGLNVSYAAGFAINSIGDLLGIENAGSVALTASVKHTVVVRPVYTSTNNITRPTVPFDAVPLNTEQTAIVVAIPGNISNYPAKAAGDVVLFGVTTNGTVVTDVDLSLCELVGKQAELSRMRGYTYVVGNRREANFRTLAEAVTVAVTGNRIRMMDSEALSATVTVAQEIEINCDPGVTISKATATTGLVFSVAGVKLIGGRMSGFSGGADKAITINGNYCTVMGTRFAGNTTDVNDTVGTSQQVGVISE